MLGSAAANTSLSKGASASEGSTNSRSRITMFTLQGWLNLQILEGRLWDLSIHGFWCPWSSPLPQSQFPRGYWGAIIHNSELLPLSSLSLPFTYKSSFLLLLKGTKPLGKLPLASEEWWALLGGWVKHFFQFFSSSSNSVFLPRPGICEQSKGPAVRGSQSPSPGVRARSWDPGWGRLEDGAGSGTRSQLSSPENRSEP